MNLLDYVRQHGTTKLAGLRCSDRTSKRDYIIKNNSMHAKPHNVRMNIKYDNSKTIIENVPITKHYGDKIIE